MVYEKFIRFIRETSADHRLSLGNRQFVSQRAGCVSIPHNRLVLTALVGDILDFSVTTRQTHQLMIY